jgi:hypothetical protein
MEDQSADIKRLHFLPQARISKCCSIRRGAKFYAGLFIFEPIVLF